MNRAGNGAEGESESVKRWTNSHHWKLQLGKYMNQEIYLLLNWKWNQGLGWCCREIHKCHLPHHKYCKQAYTKSNKDPSQGWLRIHPRLNLPGNRDHKCGNNPASGGHQIRQAGGRGGENRGGGVAEAANGSEPWLAEEGVVLVHGSNKRRAWEIESKELSREAVFGVKSWISCVT